jgi:hypothetical protein
VHLNVVVAFSVEIDLRNELKSSAGSFDEQVVDRDFEA